MATAPGRLPQDMHLNHSPRAGLPVHSPAGSVSQAPGDPQTFALSPRCHSPSGKHSPLTRPAFTNSRQKHPWVLRSSDDG